MIDIHPGYTTHLCKVTTEYQDNSYFQASWPNLSTRDVDAFWHEANPSDFNLPVFIDRMQHSIFGGDLARGQRQRGCVAWRGLQGTLTTVSLRLLNLQITSASYFIHGDTMDRSDWCHTLISRYTIHIAHTLKVQHHHSSPRVWQSDPSLRLQSTSHPD